MADDKDEPKVIDVERTRTGDAWNLHEVRVTLDNGQQATSTGYRWNEAIESAVEKARKS